MFSEKYGYSVKKAIQHESIDTSLRNRIWNVFYVNGIQAGGLSAERIELVLHGEQTIEEKVADKLGFTVDGKGVNNSQDRIKKYVISDCQWYEVYDFIEIHLSFLNQVDRSSISNEYNKVLEEEKSGYRIIAGEIVPITDQVELDIIDETLSSAFAPVKAHLKKALELYADRNNPDYENSVKESISAVESMCCIITESDGKDATLGTVIKKLGSNGIHIHGAMQKAFLQLYGYTSDEDGIRHGGIDFKNVPQEDAKYMLVSCSAFVNYLMEKYGQINREL